MWFKPLILQIRNQKLRKFVTCPWSQKWDLNPKLCPLLSWCTTSSADHRECRHLEGRWDLPVSKAGRERNHGFTSALAGVPIFCFSFWLKYFKLRNISVGNHAYENKETEQSAMAICQHFYKQGNICPGNDTFDIDPKIENGDILL